MDFKSLIPVFRGTSDPLARIQKDFNQLFDDLWKNQGFFTPGQSFMLTPSLDMEETEDEITINAELPGLEEKDISIELSDNVLLIKGEKKVDRQEEGKNYHIIERSSGSFTRSIQLPASIKEEEIEASFRNGVLSVRIPKAEEAKSKSRKISISSS